MAIFEDHELPLFARRYQNRPLPFPLISLADATRSGRPSPVRSPAVTNRAPQRLVSIRWIAQVLVTLPRFSYHTSLPGAQKAQSRANNSTAATSRSLSLSKSATAVCIATIELSEAILTRR